LSSTIVLLVSAQSQSPDILKIRNYRTAHEKDIINEFISFLSIPNVAVDTLNLQKSAAFVMGMMKKRGIQQVQLLSPATIGAAPSVYGEVKAPGATKTLIFYAHYDGQPVNPAQWAIELAPFNPSLATGVIGQGGTIIPFSSVEFYKPEWRIYARGASDDKGGVFAILHAYDAIMISGL